MEMQKETLIDGPGQLYIVRNFKPAHMFDNFIDLLLEEEPKCKTGYQRRDVGFFSDTISGYKYSGQIMKAQPLEGLGEILAQVNEKLGAQFNGILVNRYIDGTKYISPHSDDEHELVSNTIATLAFGAVRKFRIRNYNSGSNNIIMDIPHTPGALIVMDGEFQRLYTHEIPVEKRVKDARISLTFRQHKEDRAAIAGK